MTRWLRCHRSRAHVRLAPNRWASWPNAVSITHRSRLSRRDRAGSGSVFRDWYGGEEGHPYLGQLTPNPRGPVATVPDPDRPGRRAELVDHGQVADVRRGQVERHDRPLAGGPGV